MINAVTLDGLSSRKGMNILSTPAGSLYDRAEHLRQAYEFSCGIFDMLEGDSGGAPMIQIHASLDDVGTCGKDGMRAVAGYVAYSSAWSKFNWHWMMTLGQLKKSELHAAQYLNEFPLVGGRITDDDICLILAPFIETVKTTLLAGGAVPICIVTDCDAYEQLDEKEKKFVSPPEENSFEVAVLHSMRALRSQLHISDAASIQMDEGSNAALLYSRYQWMKQQSNEAKTHLAGICFLDDKRHPPVQAADMLGNVLLKTWRKLESGEPVPRSLRELTFDGAAPRLQVIHYDAHNLKALARRRMESKDKMAL